MLSRDWDTLDLIISERAPCLEFKCLSRFFVLIPFTTSLKSIIPKPRCFTLFRSNCLFNLSGALFASMSFVQMNLYIRFVSAFSSFLVSLVTERVYRICESPKVLKI